MSNVSLDDIQSAIKDSIGISTYNGNEEINECDIRSLLTERRSVSCSESY